MNTNMELREKRRLVRLNKLNLFFFFFFYSSHPMLRVHLEMPLPAVAENKVICNVKQLIFHCGSTGAQCKTIWYSCSGRAIT